MVINLTHRLLALICIPLLALIGLTWWKLSADLDLHQVVDTMERNSQFMSANSSLIEVLQDVRSIKSSATMARGEDPKLKLKIFLQDLQNSRIDEKAKSKAQDLAKKIEADLSISDFSQIDTYVRHLIDLEAEVASARTTKGIGKIFNSLVIVEFSRENLDLMTLQMIQALKSGQKLDATAIERLVRYRSQVDGLLSPALILSAEVEQKLLDARKKESWVLLERLSQKIMSREHLQSKQFSVPAVLKASQEQRAVISSVLSEELRGIDKKLKTISATNKKDSLTQVMLVLFVFVLVLTLNALIAHGVKNAIATLQTFATCLGAGDLSHRLRTHKKDELGQLGQALDQMADKLQDAEKKLLEQQSNLLLTSKMSALGEMAGGVAHEINTPLSIIQINASIILDQLQKPIPDLEKLKKMATSMDSTCQRISKIVRSLLIFSRNGNQDDVQNVTLNDIIEDTFSLCHEKFKINSTTLTLESFPQELGIECNRIQISQVLLNLLNNAFDAVSEQPSKHVQVSVQDQGDAVDITVMDSGPGVPAELREKIMAPFFTTKKLGKGTGLGLSVSKGLVEDHNGLLFLDPNSKQTRFVIRLPKHQISKRSSQIKEAA